MPKTQPPSGRTRKPTAKITAALSCWTTGSLPGKNDPRKRARMRRPISADVSRACVRGSASVEGVLAMVVPFSTNRRDQEKRSGKDRRRLRNGGAVVPRFRCAVVHAVAVAHHRLAVTERTRPRRNDGDLVAERGKCGARRFGDERFDVHVA